MSLRVGINEWHPFVIASEENGQAKYTGLTIDLLDIVSQAMNFSYTLMLPPDGEWGDNRDGNWTGLVGQLERKEVDIVFGPLTVSQARSEVNDYSVPYYYFSSGVVLNADTSALGRWRAYLSLFRWQVYLALVAAFLLCTCIMTCQMTSFPTTSSSSASTYQPTSSVVKAVEFLFGSLLQKAVDSTWRSPSLQTLVVGWSLFGLVLSSCYTSKLTSLLVEVSSSPPFTSVKDMVANDNYRWGVLGGSWYMNILRESSDDVIKKLYDGLITFSQDDPEVLSNDPQVHLRKVLAGTYAFIGPSPTLETWGSQYCDLHVLKESVTGMNMYSVHVPKGSPVVGDLNSVLLRLQDFGVLSALRIKWFPPPSGCQDRSSTSHPITIATLQGPCYLTLAGLLLAAGVLLLERGLCRGYLGRLFCPWTRPGRGRPAA